MGSTARDGVAAPCLAREHTSIGLAVRFSAPSPQVLSPTLSQISQYLECAPTPQPGITCPVVHLLLSLCVVRVSTGPSKSCGGSLESKQRALRGNEAKQGQHWL